MGVSTIPAGGGGGLQPKYQKFTTSGTFTLPDGYGAAKPLLVNIQIIGGGGGGSLTDASASNTMAFTSSNSYNSYFGNGNTQNFSGTLTAVGGTRSTGSGGGSGGLAATQMYLTANLTITVGAAGARAVANTPSATLNPNNSITVNDGNTAVNQSYTSTAFATAGSGGTTTAGAVSASGGVGAGGVTVSGDVNHTIYGNRYGSNSGTSNSITGNRSTLSTGTPGSAGQPAGSAGDAVPLLGTLAGGSGTTTAVFGSFGVGGKFGDGNTATGVDGTGGGAGAVGASGAVILTWWQ